MHGLGCSGLLSHLRLLAQLCSCDYIQTATPCLFRHATRGVAFCLCVDDLAIRCTNLSDLQHLSACLADLCHAKVCHICTQFLGFAAQCDRHARRIDLPCPSYIPDLLARLQIPDLPTCKSPCTGVPPQHGPRAPRV
jgi:hypothetical protein